MSASDVEPIWAHDREIVLSRVYAAPRPLVFRMWTEREHVSRWYGPRGFTITTHEMDVRAGGRWRFDMIAPDGTTYASRMDYVQVVTPELLVVDYGSDVEVDPDRFRFTIAFDEQGDKKTVVTMRQLHPTKARRDAVIGFGAVEYGYQTLDKLAEHLAALT
jgi:uncharacterized protein YndB with AHSA1/START domain